MPNHLPAITLSRTLGSGGTEIALHVARELGWRFCDRRILRQAAAALGRPIASLRCQEERPCGFLEQLLRLAVLASPEVPYVPAVDFPIYSAELFEMEKRVMLRLAEKESAVIVGRGGFIALKNRPITLHVRIQASLPYRIQHLIERAKAPDSETARSAILASDRDRTAFIREVANLEWADPGNFHLVLDPSEIGAEACVRRIVEAVEARFQRSSE